MNRSLTLALVSVLAISTMACQRTTYTRSYVTPLPATPVAPVGGQNLAPLDQSQMGQTAANNTQVASAPTDLQPAGSGQVGRTDLLGGWSVSSGTDSCKLFMTLTTWSGGYRANTRGCGNDNLSRIAAWDLKGNNVVLKDAAGSDLATLSGGSGMYSGSTSAGAPISFSR
ncbi:AprI/Inh family metalloprotease inhibitor [Flexibacterium corallicola]|uniref:AprI/Inh family metalloprotease inhibitor n=1 Tax=Flexibacterium corallicola TaxID=3037259 RepID=UPI00286F3E2D|nr:AprI/Inh family metalloprotease inhibitor [Pseudovibrio sp. M1P-2-3]